MSTVLIDSMILRNLIFDIILIGPNSAPETYLIMTIFVLQPFEVVMLCNMKLMLSLFSNTNSVFDLLIQNLFFYKYQESEGCMMHWRLNFNKFYLRLFES